VGGLVRSKSALTHAFSLFGEAGNLTFLVPEPRHAMFAAEPP